MILNCAGLRQRSKDEVDLAARVRVASIKTETSVQSAKKVCGLPQN
jgi:hypothetical protein